MSLDSGADAEAQPKETKYGDVLLDKSKVFHGIGFDTLRLKSIFEHGILSERAATDRGMSITRNYGGYNQAGAVSVVESPSIHNTFTFGAFRVYIKEGISFVIDGVNKFKAGAGSAMDSGFIDEAYVSPEVTREKIKGVMVPEDALSKPISELPIGLSHMGYGFIDKRCRAMLKELENVLGYKVDPASLEELIVQKEELETSELEFIEKDKKRRELFEKMEKVMQSHIGQAYSNKVGKENITLRDVMTEYLPEGMPVYNSEGFPVDLAKASS